MLLLETLLHLARGRELVANVDDLEAQPDLYDAEPNQHETERNGAPLAGRASC